MGTWSAVTRWADQRWIAFTFAGAFVVGLAYWSFVDGPYAVAIGLVWLGLRLPIEYVRHR